MAHEIAARKRERYSKVRRHTYDSPAKLKLLEQQFILDGVPLNKLANDETGRTQPSLNIGIPQYSAVNDPACKNYFRSKSARQLKPPKETIASEKEISDSLSRFEKLVRNSNAKKYLDDRQKMGAGYTRKLYGGHLTIPTAASKQGYHGEEGYRRNTPSLRTQPSVFDYQDPFEKMAKQPVRRSRTRSAPATMKVFRLKSAKIYCENPVLSKRVMSALPTSVPSRELCTGPL